MKVNKKVISCLALGLGFTLSPLSGMAQTENSGTIPVTSTTTSSKTTPELDAADNRVKQSKQDLELAKKQLVAAKAVLKAAEAEYKAAQQEFTALSLRTQADGLAEESGLTQVAGFKKLAQALPKISSDEKPAGVNIQQLTPSGAPIPNQRIHFNDQVETNGVLQ